MGSMSDTRKEIAERLGFAANATRPGAKSKFSAQFETGKVYQHNFVGDSDARVQWKVLARTASTMTIKQVGAGHKDSVTGLTQGEEKRVKINSDAQGEFVYPMGRYSMAPILRATRSSFSRPGAKAKFATSDELFRKLRLIYAYIDNEANDISDKQMNDWKKIVDEAMSSGDENIKRLAKRVKDAVGFSRPGAKAKMGYSPNLKADSLTPEQRNEVGKYQTAMYKLAAKAALLSSDMKNIANLAEQHIKGLLYDEGVTPERKRHMDDLLNSVRSYIKIPMSRPGATDLTSKVN